MKTSSVLSNFKSLVDENKTYTLTEMSKILTQAYNQKVVEENENDGNTTDDDDDMPKKRGRPANKPKMNKNGLPKVKRQPTAYNRFIKVKIEELKKANPGISPKQLLPMAAEEWSKMTVEQKNEYKHVPE